MKLLKCILKNDKDLEFSSILLKVSRHIADTKNCLGKKFRDNRMSGWDDTVRKKSLWRPIAMKYT